MYGLSTKILEELDKTEFYSENPDAFSNMKILNKVIRWKRKVFFSSGRPSFKTLVSESEWGVSQNLACMEYALERYSELRLAKYLKQKIKQDKDYRKEMKWQKKLQRHLSFLLTSGKGKHFFHIGIESCFTDRGKCAPTFFKPRKHLGFFKKRHSFCADAINVIGFTDYVGQSFQQKVEWFSRYEAEPFYIQKLTPSINVISKLEIPYVKLVEAYKDMNKDLQAVMKKKNKKKSLFRLFVPERTLNEELPVEDVRKHQISSYSLYDLKSRSSIKYWTVEKKRLTCKKD